MLRRVFLYAIPASLWSLPALSNPIFVNGRHFTELSKPQPTLPKGEVEVIEFFWYGCPHCNAFEPLLTQWEKKLNPNVKVTRIPVSFRRQTEPHQRLYYALEALNRLDLHEKVYAEIHINGKNLATDNEVINFLVSQGIDAKKAKEIYQSFAVISKVKQATQIARNYNVDSVPRLAVAGRYQITANADVRTHEQVLQVADFLIDRLLKNT